MDEALERLIDDFVAERAETQRVLEGLPADAWDRPSSAEGWSLRDCAAHTGYIDEHVSALVGEGVPMPRRAPDAPRLTPAQEWHAEDMPDQLIAAWVAWGERLTAVFRKLTGSERFPWAGVSMGARSMVTARLMEHWSHGIDLNDSAGVPREDTDRLLHIAHLGYITRDYAYRTRGETPPATPLRIELLAPSGATWTWGPEDAADRVTGAAGDFCRVAARRINLADTALAWEGEGARDYLRVVQTFAGPAGGDRPPRGYLPGVVYAGRLGGSTNPKDVPPG